MMEREVDLLISIAAQLRPLAQAWEEEVNGRCLDPQLTGAMHRVLEVLVDNGACTVPQIAHRLSVERQHVQRSMNGLIELGYVNAKANPAHRRSSLFSPSAGARRLLSRERESQREMLGEFAKTVLQKDVAATEKVLAALSEFLQSSPQPE